MRWLLLLLPLVVVLWLAATYAVVRIRADHKYRASVRRSQVPRPPEPPEPPTPARLWDDLLA